jgi:cytochrome c-type biogenesis protein
MRRAFISSLFFVLGFSTVFISLGASATLVGGFLETKRALFMNIAGIIVILLGLHVLGLFRIRALYGEKRFRAAKLPGGFVGAFIAGFAFAFGWTPCVGPILGTILVYAGDQETVGQGLMLLIAYSAGLGIPFLITALGIGKFIGALDWMTRHFRAVEVVTGCLLILVGVLILANNLQGMLAPLPDSLEYGLGDWLGNLEGRLMASGSISIPTALAAGLLSFLSPCVLPLVPAYISFISGVSVEEIRGSKGK